MKMLLRMTTLAVACVLATFTNATPVSSGIEKELIDKCGVPAIEPFPPVERIVGGIEAKQNSWPWMCSSQVRYDGAWRTWCGCSVLNNVTLLTAAHCIDVGGVYRVRCGIHYQVGNNPHEQMVAVSNYTHHELFTHRTIDYDVAILKLSTPLTFNDFVSPVCLPQKDDEPGTPAVATGWGYTEEGGNPSNELRQVTLPIVSQKQCIKDYGKWITDRMLCAGYQEGGKSTCSGDSGGPLVAKRDGVWEIQGITSWSVGCAEKGFPGVFTRVTHLMDWIKRRL